MKKLINSTMQRNIIILLLIVAIFGFTLPAAHFGPKSFSLLEDSHSTFMLIGLIFSTIVIFFREEFHAILEKKIEQKFSENIISFVALIPIIATLWHLFSVLIETLDNLESVSHSQNTFTSFFGSNIIQFNAGISFGFYLVIFVLICAIICIIAFPQVEKVTKIVQDKITETNAKHKENPQNNSESKTETKEITTENTKNNTEEIPEAPKIPETSEKDTSAKSA